ncbi:MAG: hypothetical protein JXR84_04285 [Anaerolineae bacterium]|nr:hypothetical protein [Anaerolineae bacterium]
MSNALGVALAGKLPAWLPHQELKARLDVYEEALVLTKFEMGAATACYEVAPGDVATAFSGEELLTGVLPEGCLWYRQGAEQIGLYLAPQVWRVQLTQGVLLRTPLPGMVFVGCGSRYRLFAVKQRPSNGTERLFRAPVPNVFDNGEICKGTVPFKTSSVQTIREMMRLFFEDSVFNNHLAVGKIGGEKRHLDDVRELWKDLSQAEATEFPTDELIKTVLRLEDLWAED